MEVIQGKSIRYTWKTWIPKFVKNILFRYGWYKIKRFSFLFESISEL